MNHKEALLIACEAYDNTATHFYGIEAAMRAYMTARGLVMVPKEPTEKMRDEAGYFEGPIARWKAMIAAAPDPFKDDNT